MIWRGVNDMKELVEIPTSRVEEAIKKGYTGICQLAPDVVRNGDWITVRSKTLEEALAIASKYDDLGLITALTKEIEKERGIREALEAMRAFVDRGEE